MYNSIIYKRTKEAVESNMIATIQQDLTLGKVAYAKQVERNVSYNLGVIDGAGMCDTLHAEEIVRLHRIVKELSKYKCEW